MIEIVPARPAVCNDAQTDLDILIRITPPLPEVHIVRPPVNLAIVLDRSGSMSSGRKMEHARQAATFALAQMLPSDRLSVTAFDSEIETISASAHVIDKASLAAKIDGISPRGSTALHGGWNAGVNQVLEHLARSGMNRVLLVSDGLANVGLTDPAAIAADVRGMASLDVSTSTIGVGSDYNEQLLAAMAQAGAGNYYYVNNPVQLTDIFQTELSGLMATAGRRVELALKPAGGVRVTAVRSALERGPAGQLLLPDLVAEMPHTIVVRLEIEPRAGWSEIARFLLAWTPGDGPADAREHLEVAFSLDAVTKQSWSQLPVDSVVQDHLKFVASIAKRDQLYQALRRGQSWKAEELLGELMSIVRSTNVVVESETELEWLKELKQVMAQGDYFTSAKMAHLYGHWRRRSDGAQRYRRQAPPETVT
jgi:Ca-activated chloride channel family protein